MRVANGGSRRGYAWPEDRSIAISRSFECDLFPFPSLPLSRADIRRQMLDQLASLEFRMESKLSLISEFQEFFKRRGEVEYEYARNLERICEKFEKNTKQRNIRCMHYTRV